MTALYALPMALACNAALGIVIAKGIMGKSLLAHAQAFMIASIGLSMIIQETMRLQSRNRDIWVPPLFQGINVFEFGGDFPVHLTLLSALATAAAIAGMLIIAATMKWSRFGRSWRACAQSLVLARLCGVNSDAVMATTFAVAASLAAISGWTSAIVYGGTNFSVGLMMGFKAMFASVVGGFGSVRGALAGAMLIAAIEVFWSAMFSTTYRDVAVFAIIIFVLLLKPEGVMGDSSRRESEPL